MKTIITNNCLGGRIYQELNQRYNNPFMWNFIYDDHFLTIVRQFDQLDFSNIKTTRRNMVLGDETYKDYVCVTLDDNIDIHFVHHMVDCQRKKIEKQGINLYYEHMEQFVRCKFLERVERMTDEVVFIYADKKLNHPEFIDIETSHEKILVTENPIDVKPEFNCRLVYDDFMGSTKDQAKRLLKNIGALLL